MKIHLETHDLPISNGYWRSGGQIRVYCGRCSAHYTADRGWARRYMTSLRRDLDRKLDRDYITSRTHAAIIDMHEKYLGQAGLLRDESEAERKRLCPGCGADRGKTVCCDRCWKRMPSKLPDPDGSLVTWRRRVTQAGKTGDWVGASAMIPAIRRWLIEHPVPAPEL